MTCAIDALLSIMVDPENWIGKRIEAAEHLLSYEAPLEYVEAAKTFLTTVYEDEGLEVGFRLAALKLMRKAEARRVAPATTQPNDEPLRRERWRRLQIAQRRVALHRAGLWPAPAGWDADLSGDDYQPPSGSLFIEDVNHADRLKAARLRRGSRQ